MNESDAATIDWSSRAEEAARSVQHRFGRKLLFLPGTHLAATASPSASLPSLTSPWHYWWQAQYLDCLVDAARRESGGAAQANGLTGRDRPNTIKTGLQLLTGMRLRNSCTFVNSYYDDMAWLALAAQRLAGLPSACRRGSRHYGRVQRSLTPRFISASTDDLGGGTFWSSKRDFKNTAATAPVALYFARTGQPRRAQALVHWLNATLLDAERGLYLDGARIGADGRIQVEGPAYTYNQGPILGALLELGGADNLERAAEVVSAVDRHLTVGPPAAKVLRCDGTGDRGLFTGILCRYLALAASDRRLPETRRSTAKRLVRDTAQAFWAGSSVMTEGTDRVFAIHATSTAQQDYPAGTTLELSTQLQAWMALEAAALLPAGS